MSPSGDGWFGRPILRPAKEPPLPQIQHPAGHPLVWQQDRLSEKVTDRSVGVGDLFRSFGTTGDNFFVVKMSFWLPVN